MLNEKACSILVFGAVAVLAAGLAAGGVKPPKEPAKVNLEVEPGTVKPGGEARVTCRIVPKDGIKVNKYPKMSLKVPAVEGLVEAAEAKVGSDDPPPLDKPEVNYYKSVDPIELDLRLEASAPSGTHTIPAQLKYYYCVAASGFCAPFKTQVELRVTVR
jgi:hypothetical protein